MQIINQLAAIGLTILLAAFGSFVILKVVDSVVGLRVSRENEIAGLDATQHGEAAYVYASNIAEVFDAPATAFEKSDAPAPSTELAFEIGE